MCSGKLSWACEWGGRSRRQWYAISNGSWFRYNRLEIENIICGTPLGKTDDVTLLFHYVFSTEVTEEEEVNVNGCVCVWRGESITRVNVCVCVCSEYDQTRKLPLIMQYIFMLAVTATTQTCNHHHLEDFDRSLLPPTWLIDSIAPRLSPMICYPSTSFVYYPNPLLIPTSPGILNQNLPRLLKSQNPSLQPTVKEDILSFISSHLAKAKYTVRVYTVVELPWTSEVF